MSSLNMPSSTSTPSQPIQIDVRAVVNQRLGHRARFIPSPLLRWLEKAIRQERLNELLRNNFPKRGAEFCAAVLDDLQVGYTVRHPERLGQPGQRVLYVSNHPLGGLDGIILADMLSRQFDSDGNRKGVKFVVNDLLDAVEPLRDIFVPVNKHGRQSREAVRMVDDVFAGPDDIVMFPAGLVSRRGKGGAIADLAWQKMFVNRAIKSGRDIIPLHFIGENSTFFYKFADFRKKLGLKFNIEMIRLPAEVVAASGKNFEIIVGDLIAHSTLKGGKDADYQAQELRKIVYDTL